MKHLNSIVFAIFFLLPFPAHAEIKTVVHTVQQPFGGSQSPDDARIAGIARAKREALERFGTYIESTTVVKNSQLDSDEIIALTAGVTKAEVSKQKNYTDGDGFGLEITVKVELDTDVLDQSLKRLLQDRNHLNELKAARKREEKLLARIAELEKQQKDRSGKKKISLKKEFKEASKGLTAVEWFDKAKSLWDGAKISDPAMALEFLTKAVQLDPSYALAYYNRGVTYSDLKQYNKAINDYTKAIQLAPDFVPAYNNRGVANVQLHQTKKAIKDYTKAIQLGHVKSYFNRGLAYYILEQYKEAISDYTQAIQLAPDDASAYDWRGVAYFHLKQYQLAISDHAKAIQLDPSYAEAYNHRGIAYMLVGNIQNACSDLNTACGLGKCDAYNLAQQNECR